MVGSTKTEGNYDDSRHKFYSQERMDGKLI